MGRGNRRIVYCKNSFFMSLTNNKTKKRICFLIATIVSIPLAVVGASSQSLITGGLFGFILALNLDGLIDSYRIKYKSTGD